jgi:hypothetical protein
LVCKGQNVVRVAGGGSLGDQPVPTLPLLLLSGQEYRPYTRRCRRIPIFVKSTSGVERMLKTALGTAALRPPHTEIGSSPALPTEHVLPPLRCLLLVVSVVMDQCAAALPQCPDEASQGATRSQITTETIASSMAITTKARNARLSAVYHRALSPRQPPATPRRPPSGSPS